MTEERSRGIVLYALTGLMLAVGGVWFVRSAPVKELDPRVEAWQATAERELPDQPLQVDADTMVVRGGRTAERNAQIDVGFFALTMICVGTGHVRVRVSTGGDDSGRAVPCSDDPSPQTIRMGLAGQFYLHVSGEENRSAAVFRWQLQRTSRN